MEARTVAAVARKEIRDAARNRWLVFYGGAFAVLATALAWLGAATFSVSGFAGFARTGLSLVNLSLLLVPLVGLLLGALSIAGERDRGTLLCLLAQPVVPNEVLIGKFLGLCAVLGATLAFGFGVGAVFIGWKTGLSEVGAYLAVVAFTWMLALATLSLGIVISVFCRTAAAALGIALVGWIVLVFLSDLGLMATSITMRIGARGLLALTLLNPLQVFKTAATLSLRGGADALGAADWFAVARFGDALVPVLGALLVAWIVVPLGIALIGLRTRSAI